MFTAMRIDYEKTVEVIDAAIESGINFLDTARMYGGGKSEEPEHDEGRVHERSPFEFSRSRVVRAQSSA